MNPKTDGYATPSTQMEAIAAWKAKNNTRAIRVKALSTVIGAQKKRTATETKKRQWIIDRDGVQREQDRQENELRHLYSSMRSTDLLAYLSELDTARIQFAVTLADRLRTAQAAVRSGATGAEPQQPCEAASELRQYIADERNELAARVSRNSELSQAEVMNSDRDARGVASLHEAFDEFEGRLAVLGTVPGESTSELYQTLSSALAIARERAEERAGSRPVMRSSVSAEVMSTVGLLLKMAERGKHIDLQHGTNASLIDRVRSSCPQLTRQEAKMAVEDATEWRGFVQGCRAAAVDYRKAALAIVSLFEAAITADARAQAMARDAERIAAADGKRQSELHAKAEKQRALHEAKVAAQTEQERLANEKEAAQLAKIKEQRMKELQERMDCLEAYMRKRGELIAEEARQAALQKEMDDAERQERQQYNGKRVAFRQEEYAERQERKRQHAHEVERLRAEKQSALERFFLAVEERIGVEANPDRILLATVASSQSSKPSPSSDAAFRVANGYSDEQIMKDPRVKLYAALMEAGLHKTEYGREMATRGFRVSPAQQVSDTNPMRGEY